MRRRFLVGPVSVKLKPDTISSRIETSTVVFESPDKKFCRARRCSPKLTDDFPQFSNMRIKDAVPEERRRRWSGKPFYSASPDDGARRMHHLHLTHGIHTSQHRRASERGLVEPRLKFLHFPPPKDYDLTISTNRMQSLAWDRQHTVLV